MRLRPGDILIAMTVLLPWLGLAYAGPSALAVSQVPLVMFAVGVFGAIAVWIAQRDAWLGIFVAWVVMQVLMNPKGAPYETASLITFACLAIVLIRELPALRRTWFVRLLIGTALVQAGVALLQVVGHDIVWQGQATDIMGMAGNPNHLSNYLGILLPLMPIWSFPLVLLALFYAHTMLGVIAGTVGCAVQYPQYRTRIVLAGGALLSLVVWMKWSSIAWSSIGIRWYTWTQAMVDNSPSSWILGHGPGSWSILVPPSLGLGMYEAHNEYLQVVYELGLIGGAVIAAWCWTHRHALRGPFGGALLALMITCLASFPLHVGVTAVLAIALIGLSTQNTVHRTEGDELCPA